MVTPQEFDIRRLSSIRPSPENDQLYRPIDPNDPEIVTLAESIAENGLLEPLLVTQDGWILRRASASRGGTACRADAGPLPHRTDLARRRHRSLRPHVA